MAPRLVPLSLLVLAAAAPPPSASAASGPGGVPAPIDTARAGGVAARAPASHPSVVVLGVPASAAAGAPPSARVLVRDRRGESVFVQVLVTDLASRRNVVASTLGWLRAGTTATVRWPSGARLGPGRYHVRAVGRDRRGAPLLRTAAARGVSTVAIAAPPAAGSTAPGAAPGAPSPAQLPGVFPVAGPHSFGGPEDRFGAPRGEHVHEGQDVLAAEGTPVVAPLAGSITTVAYQASGAGWYAVEHTGSGIDVMFAHCRAGSIAVATGQAVAAGAQLCQVGQTGDATGPHLHLEIWIGGWQAPGGHAIDPLPYLLAWEARAGA
jgi:murein DD-endopeptidase MepM/ murein hydrolase activator NlpD